MSKRIPISAASNRCTTCSRDPKAVNGYGSECSHCECPHRKRGPLVSTAYTPSVEARDERDALFDKQEV